ncbi:calmegin isoform X2 [Phaenicophaeus curvirostris]|uniref:calmegin isoform X2 n=1 Tax=Phaenicophaeus curvirostris TaxID=33595 RepID=UPI0037F0EEAA
MRLRQGPLLASLCLGAALPLLWVAAWLSSRGNDLDTYQSQLLRLQQRLLYAEKENKKRSRDLSIALDEIKHAVARRNNLTTDHTDDMKWKALNLTRKLPTHLTNIYYYLPHLREYEDAIFPNVIFGQQRTGVSLVMGIPTVKREKQHYLMNTLHSLLYEVPEEQKKDCLIIIFVAEVDVEYVNSVAQSVKTNFPREIQSGVLEVISPPASYYPDLSNLKKTLGDSEDRVRWRSKQNLDYSFLMLYAQPKGTFYLQLEDDIIAKSDYIQSIKNFAAEQSQDWMILEFSQLGFIGKLFRSEDLPVVVEFFLMFYKDKPVDWLIDHLLWVKVCNPEKSAMDCENEKAKLRIRAKPSLFQHMGVHSSLAGKIQNLKDRDFGKYELHKAHSNPPAKVATSLRIYQQYSLEKVYEGKDFFWASAPLAGDYISFTFFNPVKIEKYFFRSGNVEHPSDKLFNTTVEALPADEMLRKELVDSGSKFNYPATKDGYLKIVLQITRMHFQWDWLCLGVLIISSAMAEIENEDTLDADVEVEDFDKQSQEADIDGDKSPLEVVYQTPKPTGEVYFTETFDGGLTGWVVSKSKKEDTDDDIAKYDGRWEVEELKENTVPGDRGLVLKSVAKHHAISAMLTKAFVFDDKPLVVQYEVNFQEGIDCGGAYIKLLSSSDDLNLEYFFDKTPYTIMFGPDKCGEVYKLHFIFRHKNPRTGEYDEKHAKRPDVDLKKFYLDKKTHLYTLVIKPDDTFEMLIDQSVVSQGSLLKDMVPPVNPSKVVDDPSDKKPDDWDERPKIPDPNAVKPDDWDEDEPAKIEDPDAVKPEGWLDDEPQYVPDPNAKKPKDWDEEMDGEWEAPQIPNPKCESAPGCGPWVRPLKNNSKYKGKWKAPMIDNPNYQGIWTPRKIPNPNYFEDLHPFKMTTISAIGLELWSMTSDIYFDNFIICSEKEVADRWAADGWGLKNLVASANKPGMFSQLLTAAEDHPWLWVLYILTLALPVGLGVLFCWPAKKTDEDIDFKKPDIFKRITKGEPKQEREEFEDDEIEEKENEDTAEEAVYRMPAEICPAAPREKSVVQQVELWHPRIKSSCVTPSKITEIYDEDEEEENEVADGSQEEGDRSNESGSEDEMKEADENTSSGSGVPKSVRKRRVRKD